MREPNNSIIQLTNDQNKNLSKIGFPQLWPHDDARSVTFLVTLDLFAPCRAETRRFELTLFSGTSRDRALELVVWHDTCHAFCRIFGWRHPCGEVGHKQTTSME
jgi:hypothetical protein